MSLPDQHERFLRAVESVLEAGHPLDDRARRALEILSARRDEDAVIESALLQLQTHERIAAVHNAAVAKAAEAEHVTIANLPPCADSVALLSRAAGAQFGAPFDPKRRHFLDGHVGFMPRAEWEVLKTSTAHRVLDGTFIASAPFTNLAELWKRARNWRGLPITSNSPFSFGELSANLDKLIGSVPDALVAAWFQNADDYLRQLLRSAAQRNAGRSDPEFYRPRWSPPWESTEAPEVAAE